IAPNEAFRRSVKFLKKRQQAKSEKEDHSCVCRVKLLILLYFLLKDGIIKCTVLTDLKSFFVQFSIEKYHLRSGK
ncbi:MAG: hypothetical protein E6727_16980, partial [Lachnospiraceae bacterium]|nr:hypothetical protein [Lachnospiraceae bacterium]MDU2034098.1 hypothetical protein [Lachnospiraceae bacterium]